MNVTTHAVIRTIFFAFSLRFLRIRLAITRSAIKNAKHVKNNGLNVRIIQNDSINRLLFFRNFQSI